MAKKKSNRKHQFKHTVSTRPIAKNIAEPSLDKPSPEIVNETVVPSHIMADVRRIGWLAAAFVGVQLVLWYLFGHTNLGPSIYHLVKL